MNQFIKFVIIYRSKIEKFSVEWIDVQTPVGSFVIGLNHLPMVCRLKQRGRVSFLPIDGKRKEIDVYGGFFKIENNLAMMILSNF